MTNSRELDLDGFRGRATGVPPPPPLQPKESSARPSSEREHSAPAAPHSTPRTNASPAHRPPGREGPTGHGVSRMVLNVPWTTSVWAKAVAKGLDLSLADLLSEILEAHAETVAADLADHPPVGKRAGSGPYDSFTIRADPLLRARIDEHAEQLGFVSRSEFVSRLLENARRIDGQAYGRRLDERTQHLLH